MQTEELKVCMHIPDLQLVHRLKEGPRDCAPLRLPHLYYLDTCQRQLWITQGSGGLTQNYPDAEIYNGELAYEKLLSVASGLESRVVAETEVYAQIKAAWRDQSGNALLDKLFAGLFSDTKYIRSNYLTGLGGQSYGTLIRKHLRPASNSHFLIVGAGKLAASLIPILSGWRLTLTNRSMPKVESLAATARMQGITAAVTATPASQPGVTHCIVCRPFNRIADQRLLKLVGLGNFIHMGASANDLASVRIPEYVEAASLDDIYSLQVIHDEFRLGQVARARRACWERTQLRNLDSSVCLPHGRENRVAFGGI